MKLYEIIYIVKPTIEEGRREEILENLRQTISENGSIVDTHDMGKRRLAYEIKNNKQGYYSIVRFKSDGSSNNLIKKKMKLNEDVIRDMIVKVDQ